MLTAPKDPAEVKVLRLEYATEIEATTTITSIDVSIATIVGIDAAPGNVLDGAIVIDNDKLYGLQRVKAGLDQCTYEIRGLATDSAGLKHLVVATLPVAVQQDRKSVV